MDTSGRRGLGLFSGCAPRFMVGLMWCALASAAPADAAADSTNPPAASDVAPVTGTDTNAVAPTNSASGASAAISTNASFSLPPTNSTPATNSSPKSVATAPALFRVKPGFRMDIVAEAPLVCSPVAMAFDENGRLFVAEMRDYPDRRNANPHLGRIRVLEDPEGEGVFSASTVFADNLPWPSAVACYGGGVFVAAAPQVLYLKDTQGNGKADVSRVVFNGFGGTNLVNADYLPNNFNWGLDNRIHGSSGGLDGTIAAPESPAGTPAMISGGDFSFDPRSFVLRPETGPSQSGLTFDSLGRKFLTDYSRPLVQTMYEARYLSRNPTFSPAPALMDVTAPAAALFRITPENARLTAPPQRPGTTNAQSSAWMTHARGAVVYRGAAFPTNYSENAFIADPDAHVIHRVVLRTAGLQIVGERALDEPGVEFVMTADPSFRPSQLVNGPAGVLYVADVREGGDSGRIYRIAPEGYKPSRTPKLGKANTRELVASLSNPNGWERDTAARLIAERRDPGAVALVRDVLENSRVPLARIHALHSLEALGGLTEAVLVRALQDPDQSVRRHAVLVSESLVNNGNLPDRLWAYLRALAADGAPQVRYQLAFTAGDIRRPERPQLLADLLRQDATSPWVQTAALSSMAEGAGVVFSILGTDVRFRTPTAGLPFLREIALMTGTQGRQDGVGQVLQWVDRAGLLPPVAFSLLTAEGEGLHRMGSSLSMVDPNQGLRRFYDQALGVTLDVTVAEAPRVEAIRLLGVSPYVWSQVAEAFFALLGSGQTYAIQSAAIASIGRYSDPGLTTNLVARWPMLSPVLRTEAISALLSRMDRVPEVIVALENRNIPLLDLSYAQANLLRNLPNPELRGRALKLLGNSNPQRPGVLEQYRPALRLAGVAMRGRPIFTARCTSCHQLAGVGLRVGPDLAAAKRYGKDQVLTAILEPSVQLAPGYQTKYVETKQGDALVGLVREVGGSFVVTQPGGRTSVWPRPNVQAIYPMPWSLMPDGVERSLTPQELADLAAFIMTTPR